MAQNDFDVMMGRTRTTVSVASDTISVTTDQGRWVFDRATKRPTTFESVHKPNDLFYYSVDKNSVSSSGLGAITATDGNGMTAPRQMNGVGALPSAIDAIHKASSNPRFPQDAAAIIPDLYKNLGQPVPQRSGP